MHPINLQLLFIERCRQGQTVRGFGGGEAINILFQKLETGQTEMKLIISINTCKEKIIVTNTGHVFHYSSTQTTRYLASVVGKATPFMLDGSSSSPGAFKRTLLERPSGTAKFLQCVTG
jgi:hypothetical protein